jgi:hypothetical protein
MGATRAGFEPRAAGVATLVAGLVAIAVSLTLALAGSAHLEKTGELPGPIARHPAGTIGLGDLPVAARGPVATSLGAGNPAYWVRDSTARNPAQHVRFSFSPSGVTVRSGHGSLRLTPSGFGRAGAIRPLRAVAPVADANRVVYSHPGLREWYANGPLGLEQGFDVERRPSAGAGRLLLSMSLAGDLRARMRGGTVVFSGHGTRLLYTGLVVVDATGRRLAASVRLVRSRLVVSVDDRGARYPLRVDPFVQQAELTGSDATAGAEVGGSVAIDTNTIAVAEGASNLGKEAVYVFVEPASGWAKATQNAELTASDPAGSSPTADLFSSVAISGNTIAAGVPIHPVGGNADQGAVYVWSMPAGGWASEPAAPGATQTAELTASDGATGDVLGESVAVSGATVSASAPGKQAVYVWSMPAGGWAAEPAAPNAGQTAELTTSDSAGQLGDGDEGVAMSGNTIVAGAATHNVGAKSAAGAVYVWSMPAGGWASEPAAPNATQTAELNASDAVADDQLGQTVAISGNTVVAGSPDHNAGAGFAKGAAYVWTMPAAGWASEPATPNATQTAELTASDSNANDVLGEVGISGTTIAAGVVTSRIAPTHDPGAVYVWSEPAAGWAAEPAAPGATQTSVLTASDGVVGDLLGFSVAVSGSTIAAGAPGKGSSSGAAYVFGSTAGGGGGGTGGGGGGTGGSGPSAPPASTGRPSISGTAKAGHKLSCSNGSWTNSPTSFHYQWSRDGTPILGATAGPYTVSSTDEGLSLTCAVIASNAKGSARAASSQAIPVPVPHVARCPGATGKLRGATLGLVQLGMRRTTARHAYTHSSDHGKKFQDFFCLTPIGVRVGYGSPALLKSLRKSRRTQYEGRVVWASTSSAFYAIDGIRAGATVAAAGQALKLGKVIRIGRNDWYLAANGSTTAVFKTRGGVVEEIGIADKALTVGRKARIAFLKSFS